MRTRFQKRVKVGKVRLNIGKRGPSSLTIPVVPGLSFNLSPRGVFVNAGIPGSGFSVRETLITVSKKKN